MDSLVYRYVEYCVLRSVPGMVEKSWVNGVMFQVPAVGTLARVGCQNRSIAEVVPPIPGHAVKLFVKSRFRNNPLREVVYEMPPISLMVTR